MGIKLKSPNIFFSYLLLLFLLIYVIFCRFIPTGIIKIPPIFNRRRGFFSVFQSNQLLVMSYQMEHILLSLNNHLSISLILEHKQVKLIF